MPRERDIKQGLGRLAGRLRCLRPTRLVGPCWSWELGESWALEDEDLTRNLVRHEGSDLLFGVFPPARVMADLERVGILEKLRARGYRDLRPEFGGDPFDNRFCLTACHPRCQGRVQVMDVRTHRGRLKGIFPATGEPCSLEMLIWDWIALEDPCGEWPEGVQPLPGQEHPGLGFFREALELLLEQAAELEIDAVLTLPRYFHNAVLYDPPFRFFDPAAEGRFQALRRDLLGYGLPEASHALEEGRVRSLPDGSPVRWNASEQVLPLSPACRALFRHPRYRELVVESREKCSYVLTRGSPGGSGIPEPAPGHVPRIPDRSRARGGGAGPNPGWKSP